MEQVSENMGYCNSRLAIITLDETLESGLGQHWTPEIAESIDEVLMMTFWAPSRRVLPEPTELRNAVKDLGHTPQDWLMDLGV